MSELLNVPDREPDFNYVEGDEPHQGADFWIDEGVMRYYDGDVNPIEENNNGKLIVCLEDEWCTFVEEIQRSYKDFIFEREFLTDD